jgi:hypothetical protein
MFLGFNLSPAVAAGELGRWAAYQAIKQGHVVLYRSIFDVIRDFLHEEALSNDKVQVSQARTVDRG